MALRGYLVNNLSWDKTSVLTGFIPRFFGGIAFLCNVVDKGLRHPKESHAQPVQLAVASSKNNF